MKTSTYYFFYLEIALKDPDDLNVYAFVNVSHIPTIKLVEIFEIDLETDPNFQEGYFLTEESYARHDKYISQNIGSINLDVFEYCLRLYASDDPSRVRRLYKETILE